MRFIVSKLTLLYCLFAVSFLFFSCARQQEDIIAQVYNYVLTVEELQEMIPVFDETVDSILIRQQYIDAWVLQKVLLHEAEKSLSRKEKDFDKEIEEYKQTLTIHAYENKQLNKLMDNTVSDKEITQYYETHKNNFKLRQPVVKINYLKFPVGSQQINTAKKLLFSPNRTAQDLNKLKDIIANHANNAYLLDDWLLFDDILKEIPMDKEKHSFEKNQTLEIADSLNVYLIKILDFKINEGYSPLNIEKANIIKSILYQRRVVLLNSLREEKVDKAKETGEILLY
ncbi:MAG: hypothetical protein LBG80_08745 [Bacteroidales bacterium]|jgi:hypothetical protein|nr:hypothetical protein [Bacteroidales bacterium]